MEINIGDTVKVKRGTHPYFERGIWEGEVVDITESNLLVEFSEQRVEEEGITLHDGARGDDKENRWWFVRNEILLVSNSDVSPVIRKIRAMDKRRKAMGYAW